MEKLEHFQEDSYITCAISSQEPLNQEMFVSRSAPERMEDTI